MMAEYTESSIDGSRYYREYNAAVTYAASLFWIYGEAYIYEQNSLFFVTQYNSWSGKEIYRVTEKPNGG